VCCFDKTVCLLIIFDVRYGQVVPKHGYLTEGGRLVLKNVQAYLSCLAESEVEPEFCFDDIGAVAEALQELEDENEIDDDIVDDLLLSDDVVLKTPASKHNSHLQQTFQKFSDDSGAYEMVSPLHLDNLKRKEWHELAEKFGMTSKSQGEGTSRVVTVTKKESNPNLGGNNNNNNNNHNHNYTSNNNNNVIKKSSESADRDWKDNYYRKRFQNRGLDDMFVFVCGFVFCVFSHKKKKKKKKKKNRDLI
jgi:hypothetical protein